jgi:hypothetical protein
MCKRKTGTKTEITGQEGWHAEGSNNMEGNSEG